METWSFHMKKIVSLIILLLAVTHSYASYILIPMDSEGQDNHLKAYGVTYWTLEKQLKVNRNYLIEIYFIMVCRI